MRIQVSLDTKNPRRIADAVTDELDVFDRWLQSQRMSPLGKYERAILRTYLMGRLSFAFHNDGAVGFDSKPIDG